MVCYDLNVVFTALAKSAEPLYFSFADDLLSLKLWQGRLPANENLQARRAVFT
jgi:hypothetical protein